MNELANYTPAELHSAYNVIATMLLHSKSVSSKCGERRSDGTNGGSGEKTGVSTITSALLSR